MSRDLGNFPPKENFITEAKRAVTSFSSRFRRVRRAPEIPRRRGAVRLPAFRRTRAVPSASAFRAFCRHAKAIAHAKIIRRQNIMAAELKNQQHLHRPATDAANFRQPRDNFIVGQFHNLPRTWNHAGQSFFRDVADGFDFGEGKSAGADLFVRNFRQIFRARKFSAGKKFFEPRQNRVRRRAIELLVRDGLHERLKRRRGAFPARARTCRVRG